MCAVVYFCSCLVLGKSRTAASSNCWPTCFNLCAVGWFWTAQFFNATGITSVSNETWTKIPQPYTTATETVQGSSMSVCWINTNTLTYQHEIRLNAKRHISSNRYLLSWQQNNITPCYGNYDHIWKCTQYSGQDHILGVAIIEHMKWSQ